MIVHLWILTNLVKLLEMIAYKYFINYVDNYIGYPADKNIVYIFIIYNVTVTL
jgi:hypothetical protein